MADEGSTESTRGLGEIWDYECKLVLADDHSKCLYSGVFPGRSRQHVYDTHLEPRFMVGEKFTWLVERVKGQTGPKSHFGSVRTVGEPE